MNTIEHKLGDMIFRYVFNDGTVGLEAVPADAPMESVQAYTPLSLVQVKLLGEEGYNGLFSRGLTMLNSLSSLGFVYDQQEKKQEVNKQTISTYLKNKQNICIEHRLTWREGDKAVTMQSIVHNRSNDAVTLELLSSFCIGGLTPYETGVAAGSLVLHRLGSRWSDEGRLISMPIEELQLEPSCTRVSANSYRYGQVGTMPVREFYPFITIEDVKRGVCWGAQIAWPGSWQMEAYRKDFGLTISGGLADRNYGHWMKRIAPGESLESPVAIVSVGVGDVNALSQRMTAMQYRMWEENRPPSEENAPPIFNEWCTSWGGVNADWVARLAKRVAGTGIKYFVLDAGWYDAAGDYNVNPARFPEGLEKTTEYIKSLGMIPGLWFEYEVCETGAKNYNRADDMLTLDGHTITEYNRHFWDMRKPEVREHLWKTVPEFAIKHGFSFIKFDYNGNIGIGCDGAESPGEGLRQHIEGVISFLKKIKATYPDLVIENCSSGGFRTEPCMMGLTTLAASSDAHELDNIPIVAANMHRAIAPVQSQVWATVRPFHSARRLFYVMTGGMLGRLCLSGDAERLDDDQWSIVEAGIKFYNKITPILMKGATHWYGSKGQSYRHPTGWQGILRMNEQEAYAVVHTFGGIVTGDIHIDLPEGSYEIIDTYMENPSAASMHENRLTITAESEFQGFAIHMRCMKKT